MPQKQLWFYNNAAARSINSKPVEFLYAFKIAFSNCIIHSLRMRSVLFLKSSTRVVRIRNGNFILAPTVCLVVMIVIALTLLPSEPI